VTHPLDLPLAELAAAVGRRTASPVELVEESLARIAAVNPALNAVVHVDADGARAAARACERDGCSGPLAGIPFAVKESEPVGGWRSTSGDPGAATTVALRDSFQVSRLRAAGAIPVAATNLALYGISAETVNPLFGTTRNPWDRSRVPGGSSGGSAVAVATAMVPFATGSDGGGSIRIPAAACGIVGLKPSNGLMPEDDGSAPAWDGLAVPGPMARTVTALAALLDAICSPPAAETFTAAVRDADVRGLRLAWSPTLGYAAPDPRIVALCAAAVRELEAAGAHVEELPVVLDVDPLEIFAVPFVLGVAAAVRSTRGAGTLGDLDPTVAAWVAHADSLSPDDVEAARTARRSFGKRFTRLLDRFDLLVTPTTAQLPPRIPHPDNEWVKFTHPFNLVGAPAISIPAGTLAEGDAVLPVGVQLGAARTQDRAVVAAAAALEAMLGLDLRPPAAVASTAPAPGA
jgi:aspartyl-tRNA(Asn)/glutamyl-tRNA(Gln) amidotransferase subunit A